MLSTAPHTCLVYYWGSGLWHHVQGCPMVLTRTLIWTHSMKNKIAVALLTALTLLFAFLALWSALAFIIADNWIAKILGIAVIASVIAGILALVRESRAGARPENVFRIVHTAGMLDVVKLPRMR